MTTILVVDDEPDILRVLEILLGAEGYRVVTASGGKEALARASETRPDLVLSDVMMPDMDGVELLCLLRSNGTRLPVILMSAANPETLPATDHAYEFLSKPLDFDALLDALARLAPLEPG